jgi:hypothetical protein
LGYGDNDRNQIRQQFVAAGMNIDKKPAFLRIEGIRGGVNIYRTLKEADEGIKRLYEQGMYLQNLTGDNYGMLVAAVKGETNTAVFVNIYTIDITGFEGDFDLPEMPPSSIT